MDRFVKRPLANRRLCLLRISRSLASVAIFANQKDVEWEVAESGGKLSICAQRSMF
jgi:hypothetical protein